MSITVFLSVLKVIGIILLSIFAIILALLLLILFVPIRYRLKGDWNSEAGHYYFKINIIWFLCLFRGKAEFLYDKEGPEAENGLTYELKVLWHRLIPGEYDDDDIPDYPDPDLCSYPLNPADTDTGETESADSAYRESAHDGYKEGTPGERVPGASGESESGKNSKKEEEKIRIPVRFSDRLREFTRFLRRLRRRIWRRLSRAKETAGYKIHFVYGKMKKLTRRTIYYKDLLQKDSTGKALRLLSDETFRALRALKPRKYSLNFLYGFEDPALTGEVTGVLSLIFLSAGKRVNYVPDFDNKVMEGDVFMKGGIKVLTIIIILWKLYFDQSFREFYRAVRR